MPSTTKRTSRSATLSKNIPEWPQVVDFGREICGDLRMAERREWLVTNGIGGFASGTVAGSLTRRYHGLLIAALKPPLGRTLLVSKLEETVEYQGQIVQLSTNHWNGGAVAPTGFVWLERFHLEGTIPVWTFAIADAQLEKRIWMEPGENTTYVSYALVRGIEPIRLRLRAFINHRDYHWTTLDNLPAFSTTPITNGLQILPSGGSPFILSASRGSIEAVGNWYLNYDLPLERERGLPDREHHLHIGTWMTDLQPDEELIWMASTRREPSMPGSSCIKSRGIMKRPCWDQSTRPHNPPSRHRTGSGNSPWRPISSSPRAPWIKRLGISRRGIVNHFYSSASYLSSGLSPHPMRIGITLPFGTSSMPVYQTSGLSNSPRASQEII